jgi:hypothetical protein
VAWIAGIGATLFLLGAVFFFHWAVQQGWVGAGLRFALGLIAGAALTAYASRLVPGPRRRLGVTLLLAGLGTLQFSFRAGALVYHFYPATLGLLAVALLTLLAGALAARGRSGGALTVSLVSGLAAPLVFSQGGHHEVGLAAYLAVLLGSALGVPYLMDAGASWRGTRWTALLGVWLLLFTACAGVLRVDVALLALLLLLHLALAGLWAWLPGRRELPGTPTPLWLVASILATAYGWLLWKRAGLPIEAYALLLVAIALLNLGLVPALRNRLGSRRADGGLLALTTGHLALAVPVALAWNWVGPVWGLFALTLAGTSLRARREHPQEAVHLRRLAAALALLATLRWAFHAVEGPFFPAHLIPFFHARFAEGALAAGAWLLLLVSGQDEAGRDGWLRWPAFTALQLTANLSLALECARLVQSLQAEPPAQGLSRAGSIALTLVLALSGAGQWMRGLAADRPQLALRIAGYAWMGLASLKLIASDLDRADTPLRALAFLGVGGIGMAASILASRRRSPEVS